MTQSIDQAVAQASSNVIPSAERYQRPVRLTCDEENYRTLLMQNTIYPGMPLPKSKTSLERIEKSGNYTKMISRGSITVVAAKPKEGKTKLTYIIGAAMLQGAVYQQTLRAHDEEGPTHLGLVDTEQAIEECVDGYIIIQRLIGAHEAVKRLLMLSLRCFNYKERLFLLESWLYDNVHLQLVIIDGIRDFVSDPNSAEEANEVVSKLMTWSTELNLAIVVVIHLNKINDNLRGHLGSEILNKCSGAITVEKKDNVFVVRSLVSRGKEFSPFAFELDEKGTPRLIQDYAVQAKRSAAKEIVTPESIALDVHKEALKLAFANLNTELVLWKALSVALRAAFASMSISIGENKMRAFIQYYRYTVGLIVWVSTPGNQYGAYRLAVEGNSGGAQ